MGTDFLSESGDPFGNKDVINSELEVGMFVADVELSIGILGHSWSPQNDLIKWCIGALRLSLNLLLADRIFRGAQVWNNLVPSLVELSNHDHWVKFGGRRILSALGRAGCWLTEGRGRGCLGGSWVEPKIR